MSAIPEGYNRVIPYLVVEGAADALAFYAKAFEAVEVMRMPMPNGRLMHAEFTIGGSHIFMADVFPGMGGKSPIEVGGVTGSIHLYVEDVDASFSRAVAAGATVKMPPMNMFWGDRFAKVRDPFGHEWSLATHVEDVSPEEMGRRAEEFARNMGKQ